MLKEMYGSTDNHHRLLLLNLLLLLSSLSACSLADESFDVRQHLCTVTRYDDVKDIVDHSSLPTQIPVTCKPIHLDLVARHGTRAPNEKRMKELNKLGSSLKTLIAEAKENNPSSLEKLPAWVLGWTSPWQDTAIAGDLTVQGEHELYNLGLRLQQRYSELLGSKYHSLVYPIKATQVPRTSASAVAFAAALLGGRGSLGLAKLPAFSLTTETKTEDIVLRFFDNCQTYKSYKKSEKSKVAKLKEPVLDDITLALKEQYELNFTRDDISSLWFLCKEQASLLGIANQACGLFNPAKIALLEWTDDLELFLLKGYGKSLNYRMGVPLLKDVAEAMETAINATEKSLPDGTYEKARFRFAHAETLVPYSCLLGLFLDGSDYTRIQKQEALDLPAKPPKQRVWRGSLLTPFAGNNMLVLYNCPANGSNNYYVNMLHNEHPVPLPGCDNSDFCPYEVFKERILAPHLKDNFNAICKENELNEQKPRTSKL